MRPALFTLMLCTAAAATTTKIQDSTCNNNTNTLVATLGSVTAGHTVDFHVAATITGAGGITNITVSDNDTPSNTYTLLLSQSQGTGRWKTYTTTAAHTGALTITAAVTSTGTLKSGVCAIEWSDRFNETLESTATITYASGASNAGCTSTGTAPSTTITPAATGDLVVAIAFGDTGGAGRLQHTKSGSDITDTMVGGSNGLGDNIGSGNFAGWGLSYIRNAAASTAYTVGFTLVPSGNNGGGKCTSMVRALYVAPSKIKHNVTNGQ